MLESLTYAAASMLILALGIFLGYKFRQTMAKNAVNSAEKKADEIIEKAKERHQDILLKSKEKAVQIIDEGCQQGDGRQRLLRLQQ